MVADRSPAEAAQRLADAPEARRITTPKDIVDLERLIAVRPELDHAYVRRWIVDMMGESDERVARWDELVSRFAPG